MKKSKFKKVVLVAGLTVLMVTLTGCMKPYMTPILEEVESNETAFLVPLEGDSSNQAQLDSEEFLKANMVQVKRIEIPQRWVQTGRLWFDGKYVPTMRLIKVDRTPVTREWKDDKAFVSESNESIGFYVRLSATAMVNEINSATFLYHYRGASLGAIMDSEIRNRINSKLIEIHAKMGNDQIKTQKAEALQMLEKDVVEYFRGRGITLTNIGYIGDIEYVKREVQEAIDRKFIAQEDAVTQSTKNQTEIDKADAERKAIEMRQSTLAQQIELMEIQNQAEWIKKWNGQLPSTVAGDGASLLLQVPGN